MSEPVEATRAAIPLRMTDGARADLLLFHPTGTPRACVLWVPALGVAARHYEVLASALTQQGIAVGIHEWRGHGSSDQRASRQCNWGYRELLGDDLPASLTAMAKTFPAIPLYVGGHSLGGQLATILASIHVEAVKGIVLVASGSPYWRRFHPWVGLAYVAAPLLASIVGRLPGRQIGFGGNEARGVIADWARSGRTGRYAARGMGLDVEAAMSGQRAPVLALRLRDDWLGPEPSLRFLLDKMPRAAQTLDVIGPEDLDGAKADHFAWMKAPARIATRIAEWLG
ncbi:alpha/beta hydrolase family protein [Luteibacter aegosomatissinici]|uniref:alpha/beta hydrolase family protein n=1 Tax=Luteibacter aegosomatissinici TaxID=2911539 RepID=UPI001FFA6B31|nr:alpha/beta fold hydrolase [Luteibacter aegosomatissinici]UPG93225.1 alpha/beta fold hydrolase [Luteibacter aegosomatissinici]